MLSRWVIFQNMVLLEPKVPMDMIYVGVPILSKIIFYLNICPLFQQMGSTVSMTKIKYFPYNN